MTTVQLTGTDKTGRQTPYKFEVTTLGSHYPDYSGVYVLRKNSKNLYVGEAGEFSENLGRKRYISDRLADTKHDGRDCSKKRGATHVASVKCLDDDVRKKIQDDLIITYDPPCNVKK
jgi:hypothetical protein